MVKVGSFSNILDIMFAVNAVFGLVIARRDSNIRMLGNHVFSEFQRHGKLPESTNKADFSKISYSIYKKFKTIDSKFFAVCMTLSLFGVLTPVGLLFADAFYPKGLEVFKELYILMVLMFIAISPIVYFSYFRFCNHFVERICSRKLDENEINIVQSIINLNKVSKDISLLDYKIAKISLNYYRLKFLNIINWLPNKFSKIMTKRKLRQLRKVCPRETK